MQDISKTKIKSHLGRKTSPLIVETINSARKNEKWLPVARIIANSTRLHSKINLDKIDDAAKPGDTILVPGKILSSGNLTKKIRLCSLGISKSAREKLKATKSEYISIIDEIRQNPKFEGVNIIR